MPKTTSEETERFRSASGRGRHPPTTGAWVSSRRCSSETVGNGCARKLTVRYWRWPWEQDATFPSTRKHVAGLGKYIVSLG